ncbi:hypothetical protein BpHYR1_037107 [Brachionus plicatilis]|uniref:Uncharacterized protein n=1 Tax=Brachionus plicatilis TaxID=10195 RepID=A0A3M7SSI7_BRAPC|nr:hypothetical protein BpHYR1_037107 [Brachionus plicatilis]
MSVRSLSVVFLIPKSILSIKCIRKIIFLTIMLNLLLQYFNLLMQIKKIFFLILLKFDNIKSLKKKAKR